MLKAKSVSERPRRTKKDSRRTSDLGSTRRSVRDQTNSFALLWGAVDGRARAVFPYSPSSHFQTSFTEVFVHCFPQAELFLKLLGVCLTWSWAEEYEHRPLLWPNHKKLPERHDLTWQPKICFHCRFRRETFRDWLFMWRWHCWPWPK